MNYICQHCNDQRKSANSLRNHERLCKENPDRQEHPRGMAGKRGRNASMKAKDEGREYTMPDETRQKIGKASKNRKMSDEGRRKLSERMKKAHAEGRAWNIGMSRWNNSPSYPETFFIRVIENEIPDKEYIREFPIGRFSADFCWPHLKKVIEIDGEQHERFAEYKERDARKDAFLLSEGYEILRIKWKDMYHSPRKEIDRAIEFIQNPL